MAEQHQIPEILELWIEFEQGKSPEAVFVKKIDKLDAILQSKVYADAGNMPELFEEFKNFNAAIFEEFEKLDNN